MKCINKLKRRLLAAILVWVLSMNSCMGSAPAFAYRTDIAYPAFTMFDIPDAYPTSLPFAMDLCVVAGNIVGRVDANTISADGAALFNTNDKTTLFAKNVFEQRHPASLTKIMTAIVALKYGTVDNLITCSARVEGIEAGAQVVGLKQGDQLTLSQALHLTMINSANDAAIAVAEGVAGSLDEFMLLMNREAMSLGATGTNFANPHGLTDENQYTSVYDMYLILNAAIKYEAFNQIIALPSYTTTYATADGGYREISVNTTNQYLTGSQSVPENITVLGGKTGTTNAAGHCLAIVASDNAGQTYLSVVMQADTREAVYMQTTELLESINR